MPRVNLIVILMTYVRYLYSINCPTVFCLFNMLLFILWRDTASELWILVQFPFHCFTILLLLALFTLLALLLSFYHSIRSILCSQQTGEIDNLIKVGSNVLSSIVCRFHVAAGEKIHADKQLIWRPCPECREASKHHLLKFGYLLLVRFNLGFITEGNLLLCSTKPSSWGSQLGALTSHHQSIFLAPLPGRKKTSARGVSHTQSFTLFLFCFILFLLASFYQKYKKISFLYSCYFITLSSLYCFLSMFWRISQ
jgi:hypothetical protein